MLALPHDEAERCVGNVCASQRTAVTYDRHDSMYHLEKERVDTMTPHDSRRDIARRAADAARKIPLVRLAGAGGFLAVLLGTAPASASPGSSSAHAKFASANPAPNAVLTAAPAAITITFTEDLDPSGSAILVFDQLGKQVSVG